MRRDGARAATDATSVGTNNHGDGYRKDFKYGAAGLSHLGRIDRGGGVPLHPQRGRT